MLKIAGLIIGYLFLILIIFLVWVILIPRTFYVEYTPLQGIVVKVQLFLFKLKIYPTFLGKELIHDAEEETADIAKAEEDVTEDKSGTSTSSSTTSSASKTAPQEKSQKSSSDTPSKKETKTANPADKARDAVTDKIPFLETLPKGMDFVKEALFTAKGVMRILLSRIYIKDVSFTVPVSGSDAFEIQQNYGKMTAAFYSFNVILQRYVKIFYKSPVFIADFANLYENSTYFYCKVQASPSIIIVIGSYLFKTYWRIRKQYKPKKEK